jgi:hypothetical protein
MANEKRLIDANALRDDTFILDSWDAKIVRAWLDDQPTVDAVEVIHAHWEDGYSVDFKGGIVYTSIDCSHCNEIFKTDDREYWKNRFKVCPFCGAKMDGD